MFDNVGNKRWALPAAAIVALFCIVSLIAYPMMHAEPKELPIALVTLDEGMEGPTGAVNAGSALAEKLTEAAGSADDGDEPAPLAWTELGSQAELDEALDDNAFYGALVIPADFTASQAAAQAGAGEASPVTVIVNQGKNPMAAQIVQQALTAMVQAGGITANTEVINAADIGGGSMSSMMAVQMTVMPTVMLTLVPTILLFFGFRPGKGASRTQRFKAYGTQLGYGVVLSLAAACGAMLVVGAVGGLDIAAGTAIPFLWLASFCLMALLLGAFNLCAPAGALLAVVVVAGGMACAMLPPEMLPTLWADWIYPWVPQRFIGDGVRSIAYMNGSAWNDQCPPLAITGAVGLGLACIAGLLPTRKGADAAEA